MTRTKAELMDLPCACATARLVSRVLTQLYDSRLKRAGMEAPQFTLLMTLEKKGASSQTDLGRRYALDKTTVSRNLQLLEKKGWITRSPGEDRRERRFELTTAGRKRLDAAKPEWKKVQDQLRAALTPDQWDAMFASFTTVARAAQTLHSEPRP
jgi:DNA-binding MarR family transcriptional regulator